MKKRGEEEDGESESWTRKAMVVTGYMSPLMIGASAMITSKLVSKRRNKRPLNRREKISVVTAATLAAVGVIGAIGMVTSLSSTKTKKKDEMLIEVEEEKNMSIEEEVPEKTRRISFEGSKPDRRFSKSDSAKRQTQTKAHTRVTHTKFTDLHESPGLTRSNSLDGHYPENPSSPGKAETRKRSSRLHDRMKHSSITKLHESPDPQRSYSLTEHAPEKISSPGKATTLVKGMRLNNKHRTKHTNVTELHDSPDLSLSDDSRAHRPDMIDQHKPSFVAVSPSTKQVRHGPVLHSEKRNVHLEYSPKSLLSESEIEQDADQSARRTSPAQRHRKDVSNYVENVSEKKDMSMHIIQDDDDGEEKERNRSVSPFSKSAMDIAEQAWKAFEKKTSSPTLAKNSNNNNNNNSEIFSDDSLSDEKNLNTTTTLDALPLEERVLKKRKAEQEKERETINLKLREVNDRVRDELQDSCKLVEVDLVHRIIRFKKKIKFVKNTVVVKRESHRVLQQAAVALKTIRAVIEKHGSEYGIQQLRFECGGHTHAKTPDVAESALHMRVSESRAKAIRDFMIDQGVNKMHLVAKGYGGTVPIGKPSQNRRVEIKVLETSPMFMSF
jgi:outer membrane protein OmpA-like peptidoglycan-associated protein